jgi:cardiolipin synthase
MAGEPMISTLVESQGLVFTALHAALASAATVHALINKRDVRASIGWIGLLWLSPFFGAALYFVFGINRVQRKARRLRGRSKVFAFPRSCATMVSAPNERLQIAIGAITGLDLASGRVDGVLRCGDEAYPPMLAAIDSARTSVELASYIFRADETGKRFIDALARARARGVAVRVLIDGVGGGFFFSAAYRRLRRKNVRTERFLHSVWPWKMPLLDLRLHKKALIIDGELAFVGGLNIGAENVVARSPRAPVRDVHFRLVGTVVRQILDDFDNDWSFATGTEFLENPRSSASDPLIASGARAISSGPDQTVDQLVLVLLSAITSARESIRIATPYFLPEERILTALQLATLRGIAVTVVMPAASDHRVFAWASQAHIRPLLETGCSLWRSPPPFDHSKLMTIDDEWSLIGSANWDSRSLRLNFELTIELYDAVFARRLSAVIDEKCVEPIGLSDIDGRWFVTKLRDATARLMAPYL